MGPRDSTIRADEARRCLYDLMRQDLEFREKAARALEIGEAYLGVENGHLARTEPAANYWKAIESTDPPDGTYPAGLTLDLDTTYCRRVLQQESPIALHDAPNQGWEDDPAFETHGLHCYHAAPITVGDEIFGTVCFVADDPRSEPFSEEETMFTELIGQMLGDAIEQKSHEAELADRERLIGVLNRVLRHNLRNDLNVVRGHAEIIQDHLSGEETDYTTPIIETVDELLDLSKKARRLESVVNQPTEWQEYDSETLVQHAVTAVNQDYPNASIAVEEVANATIHGSQNLETALRELLENAVQYAGDDPRVTVSVTSSDHSTQMQITDNGPGLPEQERIVLQQGAETPLEHGSGIGLWLVYWIITRHNGCVGVTASESGTTITITLPRRTVALPSDEEPYLSSKRSK